MKKSEFKNEIKVRVLDSYVKRPHLIGKVGILIGPPQPSVVKDRLLVCVQNNNFPFVMYEERIFQREVEKRWHDSRFLRFPIKDLKVVGDERTCIICLKCKVRQPSPAEVPLDHRCWSCKDYSENLREQ